MLQGLRRAGQAVIAGAAGQRVRARPALEDGVTANVSSVGVVGSDRYLRVLLDETGTASVIASVMAVLTLSDRDPANAKTVTTGTVS